MVTEINSYGGAILLVEQNAIRSLAISLRVYVLENGCIALQGAGKDLLEDDRMRKAYLGL